MRQYPPEAGVQFSDSLAVAPDIALGDGVFDHPERLIADFEPANHVSPQRGGSESGSGNLGGFVCGEIAELLA
jgi:hypothetical protein